jgi:Transglycosylase SLT domain
MTVVSATALSGVEAAVRKAADVTGVDFDFLMRTAKRESGFDPGAHATTSSAAGLFQFVEQTWLATIKRHGSAHGYARYADLIEEAADGRFHVPGGEEARRTVMDLRYDPHCAALMAGELAADHAAYLRGRTGREPTGGELYAAHFLGPQGSARLIDAAQPTPSVLAADLFPEAAAANHGVFYRDGRALSVSEVYANLGRTGGGGAAIQNDPGQTAFTEYAGQGRLERLREQTLLMQFLLSAPDDDTDARSPLNALVTSQMLEAFAKAKGGS